MFYNAKDKKERWTEQTGMACPRIWSIGPAAGKSGAPGKSDSWDERFVSDPCIVKDGDSLGKLLFRLWQDVRRRPYPCPGGTGAFQDPFTWEK